MTISTLESTRQLYPPRFRTLTIVHVEDLSATMRRFLLTGLELERDFPILPLTTSTHVKVVVPQADGKVVLPIHNDRGLIAPDGVELFVRDYTIRAFDPATRVLALDFVLHEHGPAGRWAIDAGPGDPLGVLGPRGYMLYPDGYGRYVLGADQTALPALERWIEEAPRNAHIDAFVLAPVEVRRSLPKHPDLTLHWIHDTATDELTRALTAATEENDEQTSCCRSSTRT